jgi:hypothetical protein
MKIILKQIAIICPCTGLAHMVKNVVQFQNVIKN